MAEIPWFYVVQFQEDVHTHCDCFREKYPIPIKVEAELAKDLDLATKYTWYPCDACGELVNWKRSWWAWGTLKDTVTAYSPHRVMYISNVKNGTNGLLLGRLKFLRNEIDTYNSKVVRLRNQSRTIVDMLSRSKCNE